jgi:hypothetical protein
MKIIVRLYSDLSTEEKEQKNVVGIPDGWPAEISIVEDEAEVPTGWSVMTQEEITAQKAANQSAYDAWLVSRIPIPPEPEDDTSTIQLNSSDYTTIMTRLPRSGLFLLLFNAVARVKTLEYGIFIDDVLVEDTYRSISYAITTPTPLTTTALVELNGQQTVTVKCRTAGTNVTVSNRSLIMMQQG